MLKKLFWPVDTINNKSATVLYSSTVTYDKEDISSWDLESWILAKRTRTLRNVFKCKENWLKSIRSSIRGPGTICALFFNQWKSVAERKMELKVILYVLMLLWGNKKKDAYLPRLEYYVVCLGLFVSKLILRNFLFRYESSNCLKWTTYYFSAKM